MARWSGFNFGIVLITLLFAATVLAVEPTNTEASQSGCCIGTRGNIDGKGIIDLTDLSYLILHLTTPGGITLPCWDAANVDGKGIIDLSDLSALILYLTGGDYVFPPCPDTGIIFTSRQAMFDSLKGIATKLRPVSRDSLARAFLSFFNRRGEFEAAGIRNGVSVWARFADGRILIIPNNRFPEPSVVPDPAGPLVRTQPEAPATFVQPKRRFASWEEAQRAAAASPQSLDTTFELPSSVTAFVASTLAEACGFPSCLSTVKSMLDGNGYITTVGSTVEDLLGVQNYGFFYIEAHCGTGYNRNNDEFPAIWTGTPATDQHDLDYKSMLDSNELVYMWAWDSDGFNCADEVCRYAFTGAFVAQYMSFTPNAFVYISACESDRAALKAGFKAAGASVYSSWTYSTLATPSNRAGLFVIERMLGISWPMPGYAAPEESPKQRPFDITQLWEDMQQRHYDTCLILDTVNGVEVPMVSYFWVSKLRDNFELLAPSIRYMQVLPRTDTVEMTGYFGSNPGTKGHVKVNGVERTILSWEPWIIKFSLPASGPGSAGPVIVELDPISGPSAPERRMSNIVNLTEWRIPFTYMEVNAGTLQCSLTVNVHIRADVHSFREYPHQPDPKPNPYIVFGGIRDAWGVAGVAGQYKYHVPDSDPPEDITIDYFGKDTLAWYGDITPNEGFLYQGYVKYSTQIEWMELKLVASAVSGMKRKETSSLYGQLSLDDISFTPPQDVYNLTPPPVNGLYLLLSNWDILSGANPATRCCKEYPDESDIDIEIRWPHTTATYKPDPNEPR